jgi:hypothetical protein
MARDGPQVRQDHAPHNGDGLLAMEFPGLATAVAAARRLARASPASRLRPIRDWAPPFDI